MKELNPYDLLVMNWIRINSFENYVERILRKRRVKETY